MEEGSGAPVLICCASRTQSTAREEAKCFVSFFLLPSARLSLLHSARVFLELLVLLCCASSHTPLTPLILMLKDRKLEALESTVFLLPVKTVSHAPLFTALTILILFSIKYCFVGVEKWLCCIAFMSIQSAAIHTRLSTWKDDVYRWDVFRPQALD